MGYEGVGVDKDETVVALIGLEVIFCRLAYPISALENNNLWRENLQPETHRTPEFVDARRKVDVPEMGVQQQ